MRPVLSTLDIESTRIPHAARLSRFLDFRETLIVTQIRKVFVVCGHFLACRRIILWSEVPNNDGATLMTYSLSWNVSIFPKLFQLYAIQFWTSLSAFIGLDV
jgi:hypothetical protein